MDKKKLSYVAIMVLGLVFLIASIEAMFRGETFYSRVYLISCVLIVFLNFRHYHKEG